MTSTLPTQHCTSSSRRHRRDTLANRHAPTIIGVLTVTVLAAATIAVWWLPGFRWSVGPVVAVTSFLLALGWPTLACLYMPWPAQAVLTLSGALTPLGVAYWKNLDIAVPLTGITLVTLVTTTILDTPAPHDHSVERTSEHWGSTALSAALVSSVTYLLIVASSSTQVSLAVHERWSGIVPMATLIAIINAASARFGRSAKVGVAFAMTVGLVAGLMVVSIVWFLGQTSDLLPVVFPFIAKRFDGFATLLTLGSVTGFGVGFAVSVVDALLGERASSAELANIPGRDAARFLVAALLVYAMIRIDGI